MALWHTKTPPMEPFEGVTRVGEVVVGCYGMDVYISVMPSALHSFLCSSGQILDCISPMCPL